MRLLTKFFVLMLISAQSIFSLPESTSANAHPLVTVFSNKRHYAPLIVGLGLTGVIFGRIVHEHGDKMLGKLYDFHEKHPNISKFLMLWMLFNYLNIYNPFTLEIGNNFFLFFWEQRKSFCDMGLAVICLYYAIRDFKE